jgi:hypothetical protein
MNRRDYFHSKNVIDIKNFEGDTAVNDQSGIAVKGHSKYTQVVITLMHLKAISD